MSSIKDFEIDNGTLVRYLGNDQSIIIPDTVTHIIAGAFGDWSDVRSIVIPDTVTSIEPESFEVCEKLESLTVKNGNPVYHSKDNCIIETARKALIVGCQNSIIPTDGSVTTIDECAFCGCNMLQSIVIPHGVESIEFAAFLGCCHLYNVSIPNTLTEIGSRAFECCPFESVVIPDCVKSIGEDAFDCIEDLVIVASPESYAAQYAIEHGITLQHSVFEIEKGELIRYYGDDNDVDIPVGVKTIADGAFYYKPFLTTVYIPETVTAIGKYAFENCPNLLRIDIPASVVSIGENAFNLCPKLFIVTPDGSTAQMYAKERNIHCRSES